ncbi:MAG: Von Willebrand factor type domain protein [Myxococcales bacterium]|nr:Von Willebrand factor type domain protein [Myxococcales bacterium]
MQIDGLGRASIDRMVPIAHKARTSFVIAAAGAVVATALVLAPRHDRGASCAPQAAITNDDITLTGRLTSSKFLPGPQDLAVTIRAKAGHAATRPPLSLAVVIDRSGSMNGVPMRNAKAAAAELVDQLDEADAFTIVTFSSNDEVVAPIQSATPAKKAAARAAIERIWDDGGTCTSCGLTTATAQLGRSPIAGGLRRIVLISDGQANLGIFNRDELAQLVSRTAANGISISTVGVGLEFDEVTMARLADVGRGNYYFVEDTANLGTMFRRELGGLAETVASEVRLVVDAGPGVQIIEAYGYPMTREAGQVIVPIADLRAGETRKVVLHVQVDLSGVGETSIANLQLGWRRASDGATRTTTAHAAAELVTTANEVAGSYDRDAVRAATEAQSARALEQATITYERQGYRAAQQVLQQHIDNVRANAQLDDESRKALEGAASDAITDFQMTPASAAKTTRAKAYKLAK